MAKSLAVSSADLLQELQTVKDVIAPDATDSELKLFALYCAKTNLDPFQKQINFIKRGGRPVYQTSIDGFRVIAERTRRYAGSSDPVFDEGISQYEHIKSKRGLPMTATVTVKKIVGKNIFEVSATAQWNAYAPTGAMGFMWTKMPYLMLGKVAEALALRKSFPNAFGGLYLNEEMDQATPAKEKQEAAIVEETPKEEVVIKGTGDVDIYNDIVKKIKNATTTEEVEEIANNIASSKLLFSENELSNLRDLILANGRKTEGD